MRLIGGKDYYDGATGFDTDTARVFVRKNHKTVKLSKHPIFEKLRRPIFLKNNLYSHQRPDDLECIVIIFCGKIYNCIYYHTYTTDQGASWQSTRYVEKIFWKKEPFLKFLSDNNRVFSMIGGHNGKINLTNLDEFFEPSVVNKEIMDYLIENNIIIAIEKSVTPHYFHRTGEWFINTDGLKGYNFGSVVDPFTAIQELDMFIGTILVKDEDNRVQISDESKAKKHGFDRYSFRNTHHRAKPRNNRTKV